MSQLVTRTSALGHVFERVPEGLSAWEWNKEW